MPMGDPNAAFDRLDANKDGAISREEFAKGHEQRIERRIVMREKRKEGDGRQGRQGRAPSCRCGCTVPAASANRMIVMADTNSDGQITLAEAETMALQHFDRMDANKDGQVTPEERRAGHRLMWKQRVEEKKKSGS